MQRTRAHARRRRCPVRRPVAAAGRGAALGKAMGAAAAFMSLQLCPMPATTRAAPVSCTGGSSETDSGGGGGDPAAAADGSKLLLLLLLLLLPPLPLLPLGCGAAAAALEVACTLSSGQPGGLPRGGCRRAGSACHGLHLTAGPRCKLLLGASGRPAAAGRPNDDSSVPGMPGASLPTDLELPSEDTRRSGRRSCSTCQSYLASAPKTKSAATGPACPLSLVN